MFASRMLSELIFQRITHDQENSNGAFFNDFNEQLPENIFVQLASLIEAVGDDELASKMVIQSSTWKRRMKRKKNRLGAVLFCVRFLFLREF